MNDLDLLDRHGPAPTVPAPHVLAAARDRLDHRVREDAARPRRRWAPLLAAGVAAATALALGPALLGSDDSVALARTDPLLFPVTAELPPALGAPVFERDAGTTLARWGTPLEGVTITEADSSDAWSDLGDAPTVEVAGHEAHVLRGTAHDGTSRSAPSLTVLWEEDSRWTGVSGRGSYATLDEVAEVAGSLEPRPQRVRLPLAVSPEGWEPVAWKADRVLVLASPDGDRLTLTLLDAGAEPAAYGIDEAEAVTVQGSPAWLGRSGEGWVLEGRTPDAQVFSLQAPASLTREQVLEVAGGVRHDG